MRETSKTAVRGLYEYCWVKAKRQQVLVCGAAILTIPLTLAPIELQRRLIDDAIGQRDTELLIFLAGLYAVAILAQQAAKFLYNLLRGRLAERLCVVLRERVLATAPQLSDDDGALVSMLTTEVEPIGGFGGDAYSQIVTEGGVLLAILGYMLYTEPMLGVVAALAFIPQAIATPLVQARINARSAQRLEELRTIGSDVIDAAAGEDRASERAIRRIAVLYLIRMKIFWLKFGLKAGLNMLDHFADLAVLAFGGYLVILGESQVGVVIAFLSGLHRLRSPWRTLISYFRVASEAQMRFGKLAERVALLDGPSRS